MESYYGNIFVSSNDSGIYLSSNNGNSWVKTSMLNYHMTRFYKYKNKLYAGTYDHGIFMSSDSGNSWVQNSIGNFTVSSFASDSLNIFAACFSIFSNKGIYKSSNEGTNWIQILNASPVSNLFYTGRNLIAVLHTMPLTYFPFGMFYSTNSGASWTEANTSTAYCFMKKETLVYAGIGEGFYLEHGIRMSTNHGLSWDWITVLNNKSVNGLGYYNNFVYASTTDQGVYATNNNFISWWRVNEGLIDTITSCMLIKDGYIFVGTGGHGIWKRPLSEIADIVNNSNIKPETFFLEQNYPNPFNPSTTIRYELPRAGVVKLVVYDIMGREVEILVNERQAAGSYEATFDGSGFASGVYFYTIQTDKFSKTKRMVLIK